MNYKIIALYILAGSVGWVYRADWSTSLLIVVALVFLLLDEYKRRPRNK